MTEKIFAKCGKPRTVSKRDTYTSALTGNGNSNSDIETEINSNYQDQIPEEAKTSALISSSSTDQVCIYFLKRIKNPFLKPKYFFEFEF